MFLGMAIAAVLGACHVLIGLDDFEKDNAGASLSGDTGGMDGTGGAAGMGGIDGAGGMPPLRETINCGQFYTCTSRPDGTGECWGDNDDGQLGAGTTVDSDVPVTFALGADQARDIQGGFHHTCVLLRDGSVKCVGKNDLGQLGNGTNTDSLTPVTVTGITAKSIAVGNLHSCAVLTDDTVSCWGQNHLRWLSPAPPSTR